MADMNSKALVTKDEFESCFAIPNIYGETFPNNNWPHRTILLYRVTLIGNKINTAASSWQRVDNVPDEDHAEFVMIEKIKDEILGTGIPIRGLKLEMYSNYSPCQDCANWLVAFQAELQEENVISCISVRFANFYKVYPGCTGAEPTGLKNMLGQNIELKIFYGENDWRQFLVDASVDEITKLHCLDIADENERKDREVTDVVILKRVHDTPMEDIISVTELPITY